MDLAHPAAAGRRPAAGPADPDPASGEPLAEIRPSWWGYFWHLFFFWLVLPPIIAHFRRLSTVLRIFPDRITLERGLFAKCYQDYHPRDIRSIDIDQSFCQRIVGIAHALRPHVDTCRRHAVLGRRPFRNHSMT